MELQFVPRKQVVEHLENGWRLLPDHRYIPHDYAILMERVERPEPLTTEQIHAMWERIDPSPPAPETGRCKRGHYLAGHNLYARRDGRGWCCRECMRIGQRARRAAEKAMNVPARPHLIKSPSFLPPEGVSGLAGRRA